MSASYVPLSSLRSGRPLDRVFARLVRFWEARNVKKGGELMSIDMLIIDDKETMMQCSIPLQVVPVFKSMLREGSVYSITGFEVTRSNNRFKLTDFHLSMRFSTTTSLLQVDDSCPQIPKQLFRFRSYEQLVALANTNLDLPDIVGEVGLTRAYHNEATQTLERMVVHLRLDGGDKVTLTAFDAHAKTLHQLFTTKETGPFAMLATALNPKFFGGVIYLNATSATKFFFDGDVSATQTFMQRLSGTSETDTSSGSTFRRVQKIEHVTLAELNDYLLTSNVQDAEFICTGVVLDIQSQNGWNYISCSKCGKKMTKKATSIACTNCHTTNGVGTVKYRVELVVDDGSNTSVFVAFDKDMEKLTRMQAANLAAEMADTNGEPQVLPILLSELIGKKYTFHIKLSSFNFTSHHQSFTVSRIFDKPQDVPKPTFVTQGHVDLHNEGSHSTKENLDTDTGNGDSKTEAKGTTTPPSRDNIDNAASTSVVTYLKNKKPKLN